MANILLIEDNTDMRVLLREVLEWGGHQVTAGRSGEEGLQSLRSASTVPDLIICDLMLPGIDGLAFLQQVRKHPLWSRARFVLMSANPFDNRLQASVQQRELDGVLPKPFFLEDLEVFLR